MTPKARFTSKPTSSILWAGLEIDWDNAGRQALFTQMNEEIRRHARALGARFISNPVWNFLESRESCSRLTPWEAAPWVTITCRAQSMSLAAFTLRMAAIHEGLFVADGSMIPSAFGVESLPDDLGSFGTSRRTLGAESGRRSLSSAGP